MRGSKRGQGDPEPPPCKIPISLNYIITKICLKPPLENTNNLWIEAPGKKILDPRMGYIDLYTYAHHADTTS